MIIEYGNVSVMVVVLNFIVIVMQLFNVIVFNRINGIIINISKLLYEIFEEVDINLMVIDDVF